jgi:hypothetical protein
LVCIARREKFTFCSGGHRNVFEFTTALRCFAERYMQFARGDVMKAQTVFWIILCIVSVAAKGCSKSENQIVNSPSDTNLVTNGSFEIGGGASLQDWQTNSTYTALISFSTDVPINGGTFSLRFKMNGRSLALCGRALFHLLERINIA